MSAEKTSEAHGSAPAPQLDPAAKGDTVGMLTTMGASDLSQRRLEKIHQYLVESLECPDALRANLGATSSDLMWLALKLKTAIEEALADSASPLGNFEKLTPAIDGYLKLVRQIDRLGHLDQLLGGSTPRQPR